MLQVVKAFTEHIKALKEGSAKFDPPPEPEKKREVKATLASIEPIDEIPFLTLYESIFWNMNRSRQYMRKKKR